MHERTIHCIVVITAASPALLPYAANLLSKQQCITDLTKLFIFVRELANDF